MAELRAFMRDPSRRLRILPAPVARIEILAYAPTEFYHCQHCEVVWGHLGLGSRCHREQRRWALPEGRQPEDAAIRAGVGPAFERYRHGRTARATGGASWRG